MVIFRSSRIFISIGKLGAMVLVLEGNSEIGAHMWSDLGYLKEGQSGKDVGLKQYLGVW